MIIGLDFLSDIMHIITYNIYIYMCAYIHYYMSLYMYVCIGKCVYVIFFMTTEQISNYLTFTAISGYPSL